MSVPIRIVVADDHPVVREGLVAILRTQSDLAVVGEAADGAEAVGRVMELHPDVLLLDLEMPALDGVEVLRQLREVGEGQRTIIFTVFDTDDRIMAAVRAGAQGYLLKGAPREDIFAAVRIVARGGSLLQPLVASRVLRHVRRGGDARPASTDALTEREMDVLRTLARGRSNKEIAADLSISERTVKFHVSRIMEKLGASNRTEAVSVAAHRGLVDMNRGS